MAAAAGRGRVRPGGRQQPRRCRKCRPRQGPGRPAAPTVRSCPGEPPGCPSPGALGVTERLAGPRRRAPDAAPSKWRPAAPEELGARGGAQHGVVVLGPRLGPAAAQVAPGWAGPGRGRPGGRGRRLTVLLDPGRAWLPRPKPRVDCSRDGAFILTLRRLAQFTGSAFGSAAIWQYESLKSRVQTYFEEARADWLDKIRPQKRGDFRKQVNSWWNNLTEGQRTVTGLC
uniref:Uncharacterized protein n=1 Tax=Strix occidentalis caurina TaxID=311401 RepID=A0A8D0EL84_STROC